MGGLDAAISSGALPETVEVSTSESLVLGLLRQGVRKFLGVLGHGNTDIGETIRVYHEAGALRFVQCRNEIAMAHAATALAWIYGETPAVLTSIGPGALQAMAGSLAAASNGIGVYHIYGDETTHGEGPNMQQIPSRRQSQFSRLLDAMGDGYTLHTPEALREALRRGTETVHRPYFAAPFYLALPINVQAKRRKLRLESLPRRLQARRVAPVDIDPYDDACRLIEQHRRIVIKAGGGTRRCALAVAELSEAADGVVVLSPSSVGVMPDAHPRNMHVGGSKGSLSGNYAMETAELLVVVGSRAVCQSDCSGTGYPAAQAVININGDIADANHYNRTVLLNGDIGAVIEALLKRWRERNIGSNSDKEWLALCRSKKSEWSQLKQERCGDIRLLDAAWGREVREVRRAPAR
jgi:3D-(3,5/4)-trihydroxycyclohexane-1,2-dione acylhydrolase (decyclizing)